MSISSFEPRSMSRAVVTMGNAQPNYLRDNVFAFNPSRNIHATDKIDFGKMAIAAKVAIVRRPGEAAAPVELVQGTLKTAIAPKIRLMSVLEETNAAILNPALASYAGPYTDPRAQLAEKIALQQQHLRSIIENTFEGWGATALQTGIVTFTYEDGSTATIAFGYTGNGSDSGATLTIQPARATTTLWTHADSVPLTNLEAMAAQIRAHSNYGGRLQVLMSGDIFAAFANHEQIRKILDTNNYNVGSMMRNESDAASYKGNVAGFEIRVYDRSFTNDAGDVVEAWDNEKLVMLPVGGDDLTREQGAVFDYPTQSSEQATFIPTEFFSKLVRNEDPPTNEIIVESRPLPLIKRPERIRVMKVI